MTDAELHFVHESDSSAMNVEAGYGKAIRYDLEHGLRFKAIPQGSFSNRSKQYLYKHLGLTPSVFTQCTGTHTIHNTIRFVVNHLMSENMNKMVNLIVSRVLNDKELTNIRILDVGSKFVQTSNHFRLMATHLAPNVQVTHYPIRPCENGYDKDYWRHNTVPENSDLFTIKTHKGYLQDFEAQHDFGEEDLVIYFMNDCHYYFADWTPKYQHAQVYISGGAFPTTPGDNYILPFSDGTFSLVPDYSAEGKFVPLILNMTPNGAGNPYEHDNVY
jgi:hypothetical protein